MRPLTEEETQTVFKKLADYTGASLKNLIAPVDDSPDADRHVFRLSHDRVYYVLLSVANLATSVARDKLLSVGTCLGELFLSFLLLLHDPRDPLPPCLHFFFPLPGKFTKTGKFRLHITALPVIAEHARYKIWVRPNGVMPFLYGGNILKAHVGRYSEDCPEHQGIVVVTMDDIPIGFGVTARGTVEARRVEPTAIVCFRQADCGEYLRDESSLFSSG